MTPTADADFPWFIFAIFPFFFAAIWCGVSLLLSAIGGWGRLAERFPARQPPAGTRFSMQSGSVGLMNYRSVLTIHNSPEGLHVAVFPMFRLGHKPLFIPWGEIRNATVRRLFFAENVVFEIGSPKIAKMQLAKKVFAGRSVTG